MDHTFSNRLLLVPLFQGFSRLDFLDIVEKTPFDFRTLKPKEVIVRQGDESRRLCILLGGEVECESDSPEHTYRIKESMHAPWVMQPDCLFGLHNTYRYTVRSLVASQLVMLDKQSMCRLLMQYPAFQINFYNMLSTVAQHASSLLWLKRAETERERFIMFLHRRCLRPIGNKKLYIRMEDLAKELGTTRLRVSRMLLSMSQDGLLDYSRGVITIPALEKLNVNV